MASVIYSVPRSTSLYSMPEFVKDVNPLKKIWETTKISYILEGIGLSIFLIFGRYIFLIFGREYSEQSLPIFLILSLAVFPMTINRVYFEMIRAKDKHKEMIIFALGKIILLIGLIMIDLLFKSLIVASSSWTVTQFVLVFWPIYQIMVNNQKYKNM